ncbi:MAG TPA: LamG domain-containing protein [Ktedonobacterales bacterium]|nr:LamG domain-containing protein [Ktedonobacterales bacterium]
MQHQPSASVIPPHRSISLPGVHAYASEKSVHAGDLIEFFVSSEVPYVLSICKPTRIDEDDEGDDKEVLHTFPESQPRVQPIMPGSYIYVEHGLSATQTYKEFSVEVWVKPWAVGRRQAVIGQFDYPHHCGYGIFLDELGRVEYYLGDGEAFRDTVVVGAEALDKQTWRHVVGAWDGSVASLWIDGIKVGSRPFSGVFRGGPAPLRLGAAGINGVADQFADADLIMPVLYARCLDQMEIARRFGEKGRHLPSGRFVLGCWPLHEQQGDRVQDASGHQRTGRIINHATWMINGPGFDSSALALHQEADPPYSPLNDPTHGNGIRFARDDLYDCRWEATHAFSVPAWARPGIYVARLRFTYAGAERTYNITFIVKRPLSSASAPILVLCATNTWLAYSTSAFADTASLEDVWPRRGAGLKNSHPDAPRYSSYCTHYGGQPAYYIGLRMPWPNASPRALYDPADAQFGQWARLELHLHFWLDRQGYEYDVVSDLDLHRDPAMLSRYRTVVINGHSEYWSTPAYDGLDQYLRGGGAAIVLSGNSICSRVSFDDEFAVMEQRHTLPGMGFTPEDDPPAAGPHGEQYHSQDWAKGDLLRRANRTSAYVIGLDSAGWAFATGDDFGVYEVVAPKHPLFATPTPVALESGQTFGHGPESQLPRAIGHEWDLTLKTLKAMALHVPDGAIAPPHTEQENIQVLARGVRRVAGPLDAYFDIFFQEAQSQDGLTCEMIYWERPEGGRVFNAGAVGASWVLGVDAAFERLLTNVLYHFGITAQGSQAAGEGD